MENSDDKRDEQLIKEREDYEKAFFSQIIDEIMESDALDTLISNRMEFIDENFDFEPSPAYERLEELYYAEYDNKFQEQISDVDDYIDYPDGPDENLDGIKMEIPHDTIYDDSEDDYVELQIELELENRKSWNFSKWQMNMRIILNHNLLKKIIKFI